MKLHPSAMETRQVLTLFFSNDKFAKICITEYTITLFVFQWTLKSLWKYFRQLHYSDEQVRLVYIQRIAMHKSDIRILLHELTHRCTTLCNFTLMCCRLASCGLTCKTLW